MLSRKDFIFTIGFDGDNAIVDRKLQKRFGSLNSIELAKVGLFKQAVCSAVYEEDEEALQGVLVLFNAKTDQKVETTDQLKRTFGVPEINENTAKAKHY